jgi:hypothetical protein
MMTKKRSARAAFGPALSTNANKTKRRTARINDKFYTRVEHAHRCIAWLAAVDIAPNLPWVEPSVGAGAFLHAAKESSAVVPGTLTWLDIDPDPALDGDDATSCLKQDFLKWTQGPAGAVTFGNPPFGRGGSLAIAFVNHAVTYSRWIAFIVPRSFDKASIINKLDRHLHLVQRHVMPADAFVFEGKAVAVPTIWCVWERRPDAPLRPLVVEGPIETAEFCYTTDHTACTLMVQRVGTKAGRVTWDRDEIAARAGSRNFYFCSIDQMGWDAEKRARLRTWSAVDAPCKRACAGMPSISKRELTRLFGDHMTSTR